MFLAQYASKVYLIHRRDQLRATKLLQERVMEHEKVEILWNTVVESIIGDEQLEGIKVKNVKDSSTSELKLDGLFVAIGIQPNNDLIKGKLDMDKGGFVITDENMSVGIPGVFAVGDLRQKPLWQIVTAASDGAVGAISAQRYIIEEFSK